MSIAVLRVHGAGLDVDACLRWIPKAILERSWRSGETYLGRLYDDSGFSLLLADTENLLNLTNEIVANLTPLSVALTQLIQNGATAEIDVGLMVGEAGTASRSIHFDLKTLRLFERIGIAIVVSAYACSES